MSDALRPDRSRTRWLLTRLHEVSPGSAEYRALRDELVASHLPLVRYLAGRFGGRGEPVEDLVQVGTIGLIQAVDRFQIDRGLEFSTFATPNILGEIKRHFRDRGWMVRVPRRLQELQAQIAPAVAELGQRLGRSPTVAELARHISATEDEIVEATESARAYVALPLDAPRGIGGSTIADELVDQDGAMANAELRQALLPALSGLPSRQRAVLVLRFIDNRTQSEIADALGISQVHVSRLLAKALDDLRGRLPDVTPDD
jgi:RNA polymerase sigma-B factor